MTKSLGLRHCPVCSSKTYFWGKTHIHIKLTIWKGTIQWHLVHSPCCAVTTSVSRSFRKTFLTTNKAVFLHPLASASMDLSTWGISPEPLAPSTQHVLGDQCQCSVPFCEEHPVDAHTQLGISSSTDGTCGLFAPFGCCDQHLCTALCLNACL